MLVKNKTILVLGGNGFIGGNLVNRLMQDDNTSVIVFGSRIGTKESVTYITGDFNNEEDLEQVFVGYPIDIVIHLISTTFPADPDGLNMIFDIDSNLVSTIRLLNLMKKYRVMNLVFSSSGGTVYGVDEYFSYFHSEKDFNYPISSHGVIKLTIEKYIYLYSYHFGIKFLILRISNPFGENHISNSHGLINVILKNILDGNEITIWGDGSIVRDYIYIKDCVEIIYQLIKKNISNEIINIGTGKGHSINDVLGEIRKCTGDFKINFQPSRKFDVPKIILDITKLNSLLDVKPVPFQEGIRNTYDWIFKNNCLL